MLDVDFHFFTYLYLKIYYKPKWNKRKIRNLIRIMISEIIIFLDDSINEIHKKIMSSKANKSVNKVTKAYNRYYKS